MKPIIVRKGFQGNDEMTFEIGMKIWLATVVILALIGFVNLLIKYCK